MIPIFEYDDISSSDIFLRGLSGPDVRETVRDILSVVRRDGDRALVAFAAKFDHADLSVSEIEVPSSEIDAAFDKVDPEFLRVLRRSADAITDFHSRQVRQGFRFVREDGVIMGQKITPIEKVALYIPGGTASYPSTVLMNAIPAKIAGSREIVMVSPPTSGGTIAPVILAAARLAGVDRVFRAGGAQAIAALAYGTETIPRVDKIVGPGNAFVAEAKRQVFGDVAIDMIAGPSEILVVSDGASDPRQVASDMLSQAEHDRLATAVLVTDSASLARSVQLELERQIECLPRRDIARASIDNNGKIIVTRDIALAVEAANRLAPEHLELMVDDPLTLLDKVENAGSVFLGRHCPEALGDYLAGPNHTLPTSGTARFSSPLSVDDFIKKTQFTYFTPAALAAAAEDVALFARAEGLEAHARSALSRTEEEK